MRRWLPRILIVLALVIVGIWWWWNRTPPEVPINPDQRVVEEPQRILEGPELVRQQLLAVLPAYPQTGFPAGFAWKPLQELGANGLFPVESLLYYHPELFIEYCQDKYVGRIHGYTVHLRKRELVQGKLQPTEKVVVHYREQPFSVHMRWLEGARLANVALYVKGENDGKLLARPKALPFMTVSREVDGPDAKNSARFTINQFGLYQSTERTLASMFRAKARGALHVHYEGVYKLPELDNRPCYKIVRTPYEPPEEDGLNEVTLYFDKEYLMQVGSILRNTKGELISEYLFSDIKLNPEFKTDQFTRSGL